MTNCCNSYGQCTQGKDCPARGCSQSKGRDNEALWIKTVSTPPQYLPRVNAPYDWFDDFCEYAKTTLLPVTLGIALGGALVACFLLGFNPLGN